MGGAVAAIAPIAASIFGGGVGTAVAGALIGTVLSAALAPDPPSAPAPAPLPAPPPPAPIPVAVEEAVPEAPTVSTAVDVAQEPVVDVEASRVRATKRRTQARSRRLFSLGGDESESVVLTKSLLGG